MKEFERELGKRKVKGMRQHLKIKVNLDCKSSFASQKIISVASLVTSWSHFGAGGRRSFKRYSFAARCAHTFF